MVLIIDCGYKNIHQLEKIVDEYMDYTTLSIFDLNAEQLPNHDGIIISSAAITIENESTEKYLEKLKFLTEQNKPVLGIGTGHHLLGLLFDALPAYQPYKNEVIPISIIDDCPMFDRLPDEINMRSDHAGTISIPPNFKLIASSDSSINEAMQHRDKPFFGIQFLPELSGNHGSIILENFTKVVLKR